MSRAGRPLVTAAFALSHDGCVGASRAGRTQLSCDKSMQLTHTLRAVHDAVLVGIGTVLCDDPQLTTRLVSGRTGLRIVLDSRLRTPISARVLVADCTPPLIVGRRTASQALAAALRQAGGEVLLVPGAPSGVSLSALLQNLAALGVASVMVEGGPTVLQSFLRLGYVDHFCVTTSPALIDGPAAVHMAPEVLEELERWRPEATVQLGADLVRAGRRKSRARSGHRLRTTAVPR